jgi:putative DNA primase/helicase
METDTHVPPLDQARAVLKRVEEEAATNATAAYEPDALRAAVLVRDANIREFYDFENVLRGHKNFRKADYRQAVTDMGRKMKQDAGPSNGAAKPNGAGPAPGPKPRPEYEPWMDKLAYREDDEGNRDFYDIDANVISALLYCPDWTGVVRWNEFANRLEVTRDPPWFTEDAPQARTDGSPYPDWCEQDDLRLVAWFQRKLKMNVTPPTAYRCARLVADKFRYHPVRDYLNGLVWDGKPRLIEWLIRYCNAGSKPAQPEEYLKRVGPWFLISAVARIYQPGCQADHIIILEGEQGAGKSTLASILAVKEEWFAVHAVDFHDKDAYQVLRGHWILELSELGNIKKGDTSKHKQFISQRTDTYRESYGTHVKHYKRQCVFVGTVDEGEYLKDDKNRRFWPVNVSHIDLDAVRQDVDQLWAETVAAYRENTHWYPNKNDSDESDMLKEEQEKRLTPDPWRDLIAETLRDRLHRAIMANSEKFECHITMGELLAAVHITVDLQGDGRHSVKLGKIVHSLGWEKEQSRTGGADGKKRDQAGKRQRSYRYEPSARTIAKARDEQSKVETNPFVAIDPDRHEPDVD